MTLKAIDLASPAHLVPSGIVHHVAYTGNGAGGFMVLCESPWAIADSTYHARVLTEVDLLGKTVRVSLTRDLVDCMSCLVEHARR